MVLIVNRFTANICILVYLIHTSVSSEVTIETWSTKHDKVITCSVDTSKADATIFSMHLLCPLNKESGTRCYANCDQQCTPPAVCRKLHFYQTFNGCNQLKRTDDKKSLTFHYLINRRFIPVAGYWQCQYRGTKSNKILIHKHIVTTTTTTTTKKPPTTLAISTITSSTLPGDKAIFSSERQNKAPFALSGLNLKIIIGIIGAFVVSVIFNFVLIGLICTYKSKTDRDRTNKNLFGNLSTNGMSNTQLPSNPINSNSFHQYPQNPSCDLSSGLNMETISVGTKTSSIIQTSGSQSAKGVQDLSNSYPNNPNPNNNNHPYIGTYHSPFIISPGNSKILHSQSYQGASISPRGSNYHSSEGVNMHGSGSPPSVPLMGSGTGSDTQSITLGHTPTVVFNKQNGQIFHCFPITQQNYKSSANRSISSIHQTPQLGGSSGDTSPSNQIRKSLELNNPHFIQPPPHNRHSLQNDEHPSLMQTIQPQQRSTTCFNPNVNNHIDVTIPNQIIHPNQMLSEQIVLATDVHRTLSQPTFLKNESA